MLCELEDRRETIVALCREFHVARLDVFGSAAVQDELAGDHDVDFLVEFEPGRDLGPWMSDYFELRERLSRILGRPVDLVMASAPRNTYFRAEVQKSRRPFFAA